MKKERPKTHANDCVKQLWVLIPAFVTFLLFAFPAFSAGTIKHSIESVALQVTGKVVNEKGVAVVGATVTEKGTTNAVVTNEDGSFTINVSDGNAVLEISSVGFTTIEVNVNSRTSLGNISVASSVSNLDEVVVIGYGTARKQDLTAAITNVNSKDFIQGAINNPLQQIDGKVAGVTVSHTAAADPNSGLNVQIRGAGSFRAGNGPLIVIDGMPGGDLRNLSPQDIESYSVLKDAASAAIYGSRGANGVILITTKKGKAGSVKLNYDGWYEHDAVARRPDILSASQFLEHKRDKDFGAVTNWYDLLIRNNNNGQNHSLAASGGNENTMFRISGNYRTKQGIDIASDRKEYGVRANFLQKAIDGLLEIGGDVSYRNAKEAYTNYGAFKQAVKLNPTIPIMDAANPLMYNTLQGYDTYNPLQDLMAREDGATQEYNMINLNFKYHITKDLNTELRLSRQGHDRNALKYLTSKSAESVNSGYIGHAEINNEQWRDYTLEWLNNYNKRIDKHNLQAVAGYSYNENNYWRNYLQNRRFPSDYFKYNNIGTGNWNNGQVFNASDIIYSYRNKVKTIAFLARAMYNFDNTYFLTLSGRYEGNTKFGEGQKWGFFPSASFAWRMSNLEAIKNISAINDLKLRFSWGVTGRSGFDPYTSLARYDAYGRYMNDDGQWVRVYGPGNNPNPDLRWEKQSAYDLGIDFAILNNKLTGSLDWFLRKGSDIINDYLVPVPPYLHDRMWVNVGDQTNTGFELALNWNVIQTQDFNYNMSINGSYTKSKLTKFSNDKFKADLRYQYYLPSPGNPGPAFRYQEGSNIGDFWGYKYAGVDDKGNIMVWKEGKEGGEKINATTQAGDNDKVTIGNGMPKYELGWGHTLGYKNFDLSMFLRGKFKYQILNLYQMYFGLQAEPGVNLLQDAYTRNGDIKSGKVIADYFLENGNYLKMDNITLGWTSNLNNRFKLASLRVYGAVRNVFTITKFSGLDPSNINVTGLEPGIGSLDVYPTTRTFTLGLQLNF